MVGFPKSGHISRIEFQLSQSDFNHHYLKYLVCDCSHTDSILGHWVDGMAFSCAAPRPHIDSAVDVRSLVVVVAACVWSDICCCGCCCCCCLCWNSNYIYTKEIHTWIRTCGRTYTQTGRQTDGRTDTLTGCRCINGFQNGSVIYMNVKSAYTNEV